VLVDSPVTDCPPLWTDEKLVDEADPPKLFVTGSFALKLVLEKLSAKTADTGDITHTSIRKTLRTFCVLEVARMHLTVRRG
jgi:hypothetical protein